MYPGSVAARFLPLKRAGHCPQQKPPSQRTSSPPGAPPGDRRLFLLFPSLPNKLGVCVALNLVARFHFFGSVKTPSGGFKKAITAALLKFQLWGFLSISEAASS